MGEMANEVEQGHGDFTKIDIRTDPLQQRMRGTTMHGDIEFDVPYISHIKDNLWTGGCQAGLVLPDNIRHVVSLYPWERYKLHEFVESELYFRAYDADISLIVEGLQPIVEWILSCLAKGPTLVHCQAGLNRSGLLAALVLMRRNFSPREAITLLRGKRSPAVLCNRSFEEYLLSPRPRTHSILRGEEA
jgi:protein-tyrosine phosphatase